MFIVPIDIQDGVNDLHTSTNESIFFSFVCQMMHMNAQNCYWMLIKMQISLLNLIYAQMFVLSRSWMSLRAIEGCFTQMIAYFLVMNSKRCNKRFISQLNLFQPFSVTWKKTNYKCNRMSALTVLYNNQLYNIVGYLYSFRALSVK